MRRFLLTLSLAPLFAPLPASADTLEDALFNAYNNNPNMTDARLAVRSAREDRAQATAGWLPQLGVTGSYGVSELDVKAPSFFGGTSHTETQLNPQTTTVQLQQQLFTGGRRIGQSMLANAGVDSAKEGLRSTEQDVLLQTVEAYLSVRRDEQIVTLSEQHVAGLTTQLQGTQRRLDVGEVSRTDVAQAQTRLASARAQLARARATLEGSRARYVAVVGKAPENLAAPPTPVVPASLNESVAQAETEHPDLLQARSGERAARARVTIERSALLPQVSLVGRYDTQEEPFQENEIRQGSSAAAQVSIPLFEGGYSWSRTRQSHINVRRAQARTEAQRREVEANVLTAWNDYSASSEVLTAAHEQVDAAELALRGVERERGLGLRDTLDVLNAEEELRDARINLARAEAQSTFSAYNLLSSTGALSLESLGMAN